MHILTRLCAVVLAVGATACGPSIEITKALEVTDVTTGWFDAGITNGMNKLVPSLTFKARNVSNIQVESVQFNAVFRVVDDPLRPRGLRSRPVDVEGIAARRCAIVDDGVLTTWMLDLRSARQLGMPPTGHAGRSTASPPAPTSSNVYLEPGESSADALIRVTKALVELPRGRRPPVVGKFCEEVRPTTTALLPASIVTP